MLKEYSKDEVEIIIEDIRSEDRVVRIHACGALKVIEKGLSV